MADPTVKRVLIAVGEPAEIESICLMLRGQNVEVRAVTSPDAVVPAAREFQPDAILLDLQLQGQSTTYIARALRKEPMFVAVIVIAVAGNEDEECRRRLAGAGFDYVLARPLSAPDLLAAITSR
jgi:CheY-like chemotaxis protein